MAKTTAIPATEIITTKMSELALIHKKAINTIKSSNLGIFLDVSSGVSTVGLAIHLSK